MYQGQYITYFARPLISVFGRGIELHCKTCRRSRRDDGIVRRKNTMESSYIANLMGHWNIALRGSSLRFTCELDPRIR